MRPKALLFALILYAVVEAPSPYAAQPVVWDLPGPGKQIGWDAGADVVELGGDRDQVHVIARDSLELGDVAIFALPGGAALEMVWIEPGTFRMGTTEEQKMQMIARGLWDAWFENEQPAHEVTISRGFWLGKYEITQEQ